ncbi:hypothetical protein OAO87_02905 [bacterium]|nr:hypothetical protein [bacterium]
MATEEVARDEGLAPVAEGAQLGFHMPGDGLTDRQTGGDATAHAVPSSGASAPSSADRPTDRPTNRPTDRQSLGSTSHGSSLQAHSYAAVDGPPEHWLQLRCCAALLLAPRC